MDSSTTQQYAREVKQIIRSLLAACPNAALAYDGKNKLAYVNDRAAQHLGIADPRGSFAIEELALTLRKVDEQSALPENQTPWMHAWSGKAVHNLEVFLQVPNKKPMLVLCSAKLVTHPSEDTALVALVTITDISKRYEQKQELQHELEHLRTILEGTKAGTWEWNIQTGKMRFSSKWTEVLGYSPEELSVISPQAWRALQHPDDLKAAEDALRSHLRRETALYDVTARIRHKQGHWVWLQIRGRTYQWDKDGKAVWLAGIHVDVSGAKLAEDATRTSQAYMQAVINSSADVALLVTDTNGVFTIFSPGAQKLLGYSEEELLGKHTPAILHLESEVAERSKELSAEVGMPISGFEVFVHAARKGSSETRRWTYISKDGQHHKVSLSVSALRDGDEDKIIGFLGIAIDETARLAAEEEAMLAAQRFSGAFQSTAVGMALVSLEEAWMAVNDALCDMLGYSRDELLITDFQTLTHPDDLSSDLSLLNKLLAGQLSNYAMQKRYYRKTGELIHASLWVSLVTDQDGTPLHFVSQIQNISEEFNARRQLESSEGRLRGLFDLSPIGIVLMDYKTGQTIEANQAAITPTGYSPQEFLQLNDSDLTPQEYTTAVARAAEQLSTIGRFEPFEKEYIRKDGSRYPVLVQGILLTEPSGRSVIWTLIEDITERKRIERIKNEFVSTVSHELRTPLTSIAGALSLIVGGVLGEVPDEILNMLKIAATSSDRLSALVNDLLDMDKLLAGKMDLKLELIDLHSVMNDAVNGMQAFAQSHSLIIEQTGQEEIRLRTDKGRLLQVLSNLLSNACKHSHAGGKVRLHYSAGQAA